MCMCETADDLVASLGLHSGRVGTCSLQPRQQAYHKSCTPKRCNGACDLAPAEEPSPQVWSCSVCLQQFKSKAGLSSHSPRIHQLDFRSARPLANVRVHQVIAAWPQRVQTLKKNTRNECGIENAPVLYLRQNGRKIPVALFNLQLSGQKSTPLRFQSHFLRCVARSVRDRGCDSADGSFARTVGHSNSQFPRSYDGELPRGSGTRWGAGDSIYCPNSLLP